MKFIEGMLEEMAGVKRESMGEVSQEVAESIRDGNIALDKANECQDEEAFDRIKAELDEVWAGIYEDLHLDPNGLYTVNVADKVVYEKVYPEKLAKMMIEDKAVPEGMKLRTYKK